MIEEMIDSIIEAEDKAQEIVKASVNGAKQAAIEAGEKKGSELRAAQLEEAQKQADAMIDALEKNKKKVTASIIKELKGKYGIK